MTCEVISLGCRLNLAESESLRTLLANGNAGTDDLVVINSCAVTSEALRQTRQAIRRARRVRPGARLLVTGCAAEIDRDAIVTMPEVDGLIANHAKLDPRVWNVAPGLGLPVASRHTRAFIAAQTGCDHACTFCVIPQGRGSSRSRSIAEVVADIARHLDQGAREVILTGVDLTAWGLDLADQPRLGALVAAILRQHPDLLRLRLSSLDGVEIDDELLELLAGEPRVMPHLHLSLQHGDDIILKRMKRRHLRRDAVALVAQLRARRGDLAIGADLIAGFPTEDDAAHRANLAIIAELGIVHGHVFPYSARAQTPAARMPQTPLPVIRARAAQLRTAVAAEHAGWQLQLIGTALVVLAERDGTGHAANFARVRLPAGAIPGTVLTITPTRIDADLLA